VKVKKGAEGGGIGRKEEGKKEGEEYHFLGTVLCQTEPHSDQSSLTSEKDQGTILY